MRSPFLVLGFVVIEMQESLLRRKIHLKALCFEQTRMSGPYAGLLISFWMAFKEMLKPLLDLEIELFP